MSCSLLQRSTPSGEARSSDEAEVRLSTVEPMRLSDEHVKLGLTSFCEFASTQNIHVRYITIFGVCNQINIGSNQYAQLQRLVRIVEVCL